MTWGQIIHAFASDTKVHVALLLVAIDFVLGGAAAFKLSTFRLSYIADFLRNDIAFKLLPYFFIFAAALVAGSESIIIPGLDLSIVADGAYGVLVLAWVGSVLNSIRDLGFMPTSLSRQAVSGAENAAPPKD